MSDEQVVDPVNDAGSVGAVDGPVGDAGAGVAEDKPFFTYTGDDGVVHDFRNAGEVADAFKHSSFRKADHDREMGQVSSRGKYLEDQIRKFKEQEQALSESPAMRYHKFLTENPDKAARLKAEFAAADRSGAPGLQNLLDEKLKPIIERQEGYDKAEAERAAEGRRKAAFKRIQERFGSDIQESVFTEELKRIQDIPKQDVEYALYELLLHSHRGRTNPAELERRAAESASRKKTPSLTSTPGVKPTGRDPNAMSPAERREAAAKLLPG